MTGESLLIIDDDITISDYLNVCLSNEGYEVYNVQTSEEAQKLLHTYIPDLILLDLNLPGMGGFDFCKILKNNSYLSAIPIIMLTSDSSEESVVIGLESGADDYINKKSSQKVLLARIKAVLRRKFKINTENNIENDSILKIKNLIIDSKRYEVFVSNKIVDLSVSEFKILYFLALKPGWVFTRTQIIEYLDNDSDASTERTIDVLIVSLRKKLSPYNDCIETVRGVGYSFKE